MRTLGVWPDKQGLKGVEWLYWQLAGMNNKPCAWGTPDGYPIVADEWRSASAMLSRINIVTNLASGWQKDLTCPPLRNLLPKTKPATRGALIDALYPRLHYRTIIAADRAAVCSYFGVTPSSALTSTDPLLTGKLPTLVSILLNAPALAVY